MRMSTNSWLILLAGSIAGLAHAQEGIQLEDAETRQSYSLGYQMGTDLASQELTFDRAAVMQGLQDGVAGTEPAVPEEQMQQLIAEVKRKIVAKAEKDQEAQLEATKQASVAFMEENKTKPGVQTTDSGLQYKVIKEGSGRRPGPTDKVRVHYRGKTVSGMEIDNSYERGEPADLKLRFAMKGWSEGLQLMQEGAKYELYVPYELAYNARPPLAYEALIFEVELLEVNPKPTEFEVLNSQE